MKIILTTIIPKVNFKLGSIIDIYNSQKSNYTWLVNQDIDLKKVPNFYPSFWEDVKLYTFGETNDIILAPRQSDVNQLYDIHPSIHYNADYTAKPMDIVFISYGTVVLGGDLNADVSYVP